MLAPNVRASKVVVLKEKRQLHLYRKDKLLKIYRIALGGAPEGPKKQQGDEKTPEGLYRIDWRNPQSGYHLSLHVSYPDKNDRQQAQKAGYSPGGDIMIHGLPNGMGWIGRFHALSDWTNGCIAVSDTEIEELWRAVPNGTPIEIRP